MVGTSSAGNGRPALTALAAGAAIGLAAAAARAVLERLRRNPVLSPGGRNFPDAAKARPNPAPISARKDPDLPEPAGTVTVEVSSLDAGTGSPHRTWIVHNGPEWQSQPGELVVPPEHPREGDWRACL